MSIDIEPDFEVAVVGAGFSGIGAGIRLRDAGIYSFVIFEQAADLGGTWRDNTYPGVAVDIPSLTYSFSFEQNPRWSRLFAPGNELKAYADHCADKYRLRGHLRCGAKVKQLAFDEQAHLWTIHIEGQAPVRARFVISATGVLTQPKYPAIPGLDAFKGQSVHTARWNHDIDLRGKRIGMIGTGASAVQILPELARAGSQVHVYQRTPIWVFPKFDGKVPRGVQQLFKRVPATQSSARMVTSAFTELLMVVGVVHNKQAPWLVRSAEKICLHHLAAQVHDPELRRKLTPAYGFGCKRPTFSNDYLRAFNKPNVELLTDSIAEVTPRGIRTADGTARELDALVLATGFKVFEDGNLPAFEVRGSSGEELHDFWLENRHQAYEGTSVPGFPNFFLMVGPYSVSGSSWFSLVEAQSAHALRCIVEARRRKATYVEVTREANAAYFRDVLAKQANTVFFNNNCGQANSYYFDQHGDAPFLRPSSGIEMWWRSRHFSLKDYRFHALRSRVAR